MFIRQGTYLGGQFRFKLIIPDEFPDAGPPVSSYFSIFRDYYRFVLTPFVMFLLNYVHFLNLCMLFIMLFIII